jgi:hypothetical protein
MANVMMDETVDETPEYFELVDLLECDLVEAYLFRLFRWCLRTENIEGIARLTPRSVASITRYHGDPTVLFNALVKTRYLQPLNDGTYCIRGAKKRNAKFFRERIRQREKQAKYRAARDASHTAVDTVVRTAVLTAEEPRDVPPVVPVDPVPVPVPKNNRSIDVGYALDEDPGPGPSPDPNECIATVEAAEAYCDDVGWPSISRAKKPEDVKRCLRSCRPLRRELDAAHVLALERREIEAAEKQRPLAPVNLAYVLKLVLTQRKKHGKDWYAQEQKPSPKSKKQESRQERMGPHVPSYEETKRHQDAVWRGADLV